MSHGRPEPVEVRRVDPDPAIASAIGRHHSLATAIADLVDNSIDARATQVLIRFVLREGRAVGLLVVDNGCGMDADTVDEAMGYARRREYAPGDLGHFGIGMKAASLSQADTLWVWSHRYGCPPVGRGLERSSLDTGPMVQEFSADDATAHLGAAAGWDAETGTVVEWRDVRGFLQSPDEDEQRSWLDGAAESVRTHLGLVLHRIVAMGQVRITLDQWDQDFGAGVPRRVEPLDPFGYHGPARPGYPRRLDLTLGGRATAAWLHVWPQAPGAPEWRLGGRPPTETQGLYVYRNDRLLQAGGWGPLTSPSRDLEPARVAVDLDDVLEPHVTINPEKTGVVLDATLVASWNTAVREGGGTFLDYLSDVKEVATAGRARRRRPVVVAEPHRGFTAAVRDSFEENAAYRPDGAPVDVRWRALMDDEVFRVDPGDHTIWLNSRYRAVLGGASGLANDDAQVTKALVHVLVGQYAGATLLSASARQDVAAWNAILLAAVQDTERRHVRPPGRHADPTSVTEDDE